MLPLEKLVTTKLVTLPDVISTFGELKLVTIPVVAPRVVSALTLPPVICALPELKFVDTVVVNDAGDNTVVLSIVIVAELSAAGVASYLVPFPHAVDDHQTSNAKFLADAGAAKLVQQKDLTAEGLAAFLQTVTRDELLNMAEMALTLAKPLATREVADICKELSQR